MSERMKLKRVGEPLSFQQAMSALLKDGVMVQPDSYGALALVFRKNRLGLINSFPSHDPSRCLVAWAREHTADNWYIVEEVKGPSFEDVRQAANAKGVEVYELDACGSYFVRLVKKGSYIECRPKPPKTYTLAMKILESGVFDDN